MRFKRMKQVWIFAAFSLFLLVNFGCKDDDATGPGTSENRNFMTARIGADSVFGVGNAFVNVYDETDSVLTLQGWVGTSGDSTLFIIITVAEQFAALNTSLTLGPVGVGGAQLYYRDGRPRYQCDGGQIVLTSRTQYSVSGMFEFHAYQDYPPGSDTKVVTNGSFTLSFVLD